MQRNMGFHTVRKEFFCRCQAGQDKTDPPPFTTSKPSQQELGVRGVAAGVVPTQLHPFIHLRTSRVQCSQVSKAHTPDKNQPDSNL